MYHIVNAPEICEKSSGQRKKGHNEKMDRKGGDSLDCHIPSSESTVLVHSFVRSLRKMDCVT